MQSASEAGLMDHISPKDSRISGVQCLTVVKIYTVETVARVSDYHPSFMATKPSIGGNRGPGRSVILFGLA